MKHLAGYAFIVVVALVAEAAANARLVSPAIFPPPSATLQAFASGFTSGTFWLPLVATVGHMLAGWGSACLLGIVLGALVGTTSFGRAYVAPTLEFLRPLPASAVAPVGLLLIGRNDAMIVAVILFGSIWPVLLGSVHGFASVEPRLREVSRMLRLRPLHAFAAIALPSALPEIIAGARIAIALALILAVVAEILASAGGLGDQLNVAERSYQTAALYAGILLIGLLGALTNLGLERIEAYLLRWKPAPARF